MTHGSCGLLYGCCMLRFAGLPYCFFEQYNISCKNSGTDNDASLKDTAWQDKRVREEDGSLVKYRGDEEGKPWAVRSRMRRDHVHAGGARTPSGLPAAYVWERSERT